MERTFGVPSSLEKSLSYHFESLEALPSKYPYIPETIVGISNHFQIKKQRTTPWTEARHCEAYSTYFHVLNSVRLLAVFSEAQKRIPDFAPKYILDFGSGLGATEIAFQQVFSHLSPLWSFVENEQNAKVWHKKLRGTSDQAHWHSKLVDVKETIDLFVASYALNELEELPKEALNAKTIILVEPSTQSTSRKLMALRETLIKKKFNLVAPCVHQLTCPLLKHSKKDWCYDRIHFEQPSWFTNLESKLPMKNRTLTFSYLIATKLPLDSQNSKGVARIIGDTLKEKGKTKQMICRSEHREFLAWLKRHGKPPYVPHGAMVKIPESYEIVSNEVRSDGSDLEII